LCFFAARPDFALALCRAISEKLTWSTRRLIDFGGLPVRLRVARVLGELALLYGRPTGDQIVFDYALTQMELAAMVGASEAGVFRALRELRAAGIIGTGYRRVMIIDLPALLAATGTDALLSVNTSELSVRSVQPVESWPHADARAGQAPRAVAAASRPAEPGGKASRRCRGPGTPADGGLVGRMLLQ
jgi:hypothetical protein